MEKFSFGYSVKNIPIPSEREYKLQLMESIEKLIKKMRWKFIFADDDKDNPESIERNTYGLKSRNCPKPVKELSAFEKDLCEFINQIKLRMN